MNDEIVREGDPRLAKVERSRTEVKDFKKKMAEIERAPLPPADMRDALGKAFNGEIHGTIAFGGFGGFLQPQSKFHNHQWPELTWSAVAELFGAETLIDRAAAYLDSKRNGEPGLPLAERPAALAKLRTKLEAKERAEELAIIELERQGLTVLRRVDLNVELVLSVHRGLGEGEAAHEPETATRGHDDDAKASAEVSISR